VRAAKAGRPGAAAALIERHYPRVYSFVNYLTSGRSNAEDITQEVFAKALTALGTFNGQYQFAPWLIKIAKNLVIDESRKDVHRASPTDPQVLPDLEPMENPDHVWTSMSQQIASRQVRHALAKLPMRQRTALVLKEIEQMSYSEIALVLGTNVRGVEGTLRRAKARFRLEATQAEAVEGQVATCKRTLRLVALDGEARAEAAPHLMSCVDCRKRADSIRSSDALFAALPVLAMKNIAWQGKVATLAPKRVGSLAKRLSAMFHSSGGLGVPIASGLQVAAAVVVAGAVSATGVAGYQRVRNDIAASAFVAPSFSSEFKSDSANQIASVRPIVRPANPTVTTAGASPTAQAGASRQSAPALVNSVLDLLGAQLPPQLGLQNLPVQQQLNYLAELPDAALAQLAQSLNLKAGTAGLSRDALLAQIQQSLLKLPIAPGATGTAPVASVGTTSPPATSLSPAPPAQTTPGSTVPAI